MYKLSLPDKIITEVIAKPDGSYQVLTTLPNGEYKVEAGYSSEVSTSITTLRLVHDRLNKYTDKSGHYSQPIVFVIDDSPFNGMIHRSISWIDKAEETPYTKMIKGILDAMKSGTVRITTYNPLTARRSIRSHKTKDNIRRTYRRLMKN